MKTPTTVVAAALLNTLELQGKKIEKIRLVILGTGGLPESASDVARVVVG